MKAMLSFLIAYSGIAQTEIASEQPTGLHLERSGELSSAALILEHLISALKARTGKSYKVSDPMWLQCKGRCLEALSAQLGTNSLLLISIYPSISKLRVVAERFLDGKSVQREKHDLSVDTEQWPKGLAKLAEALTPGASPKLSSKANKPLTKPSLDISTVNTGSTVSTVSARTWLSLGSLGAGIGLGALGLGFALSSNSARSALESRAHFDIDHDRLSARHRGHGIAAYVFLSSAVLGVAVSALLWALDQSAEDSQPGAAGASR